MSFKFKPLHNRVVLKDAEAEKVSAGGIIIPETAQNKNPVVKATVVATGPGKRVEGVLVSTGVSEGNTVLVEKYAGETIELDGVKYRTLDADLILGVVES